MSRNLHATQTRIRLSEPVSSPSGSVSLETVIREVTFAAQRGKPKARKEDHRGLQTPSEIHRGEAEG